MEFIVSYRRFHLLKSGHMTKEHDLIVYHTLQVLSPNSESLRGFFAAHSKLFITKIE